MLNDICYEVRKSFLCYYLESIYFCFIMCLGVQPEHEASIWQLKLPKQTIGAKIPSNAYLW